MPASMETIKELRELTGVGILDAKKALEEAGGEIEKAVELLRKHGQKVAAKKAERTAGEGWIGMYIHHNGKVGAMVELRCETDFVSRNEQFQEVAKQIAMHVAAANPAYLSEKDVPADVVAKEEEIAREQLLGEGKPAEMIEKILPGKVKKFYAEQCLLYQAFILDDKKTITDVITDATAKMGEKIEITRFTRFGF